MKRILLLSMVLMVSLSGYVMAQRTVTGTVTAEEDGTPVPGVNVIVKGTSAGTVTDIDGKYQIGVPDDGGILVFSFIGLATEEVEIGNQSQIEMVMTADIKQLTEVVVTALGITREKASLGYSTQSLDNEDVSTVKEQNFVNSLSGKISGVQIRQNATMGGSSNITVRGNNSVTGNNQPLFVVDGIPVDNGTDNDAYQVDGRRGYDYGNAAADINPDDIETLNVLKGAAATALYGSRAANGAIIITTKKGKARKGIGVDFSTSYTMGQIDKSTFISYQDTHGAGYGKYYGPTGDLYEFDVNGDGTDDFVAPTGEDGSYGAQFSDWAGTPVWQWDSYFPESENFGRAYEYKAGATTPVDFFETSHTYNNSVSLHGGDEKNTFRIGYTNYSTTGVLPNSKINKNNFSLSATSKIHKRLTADVSLNWSKNDATGRFSTGYGDNLMAQFRQWWQVNVDVNQLKEIYEKSGGLNRTWNMLDGTALGDEIVPHYWDNPYWTRYKNYSSDSRTRLMGQVSLTYEINDWLSLMGRFAADDYRMIREERRAVGSVATEFGINKLDEESGYNRKDIVNSEYNADFILTADTKLTQDISFYGILGTNIRRNNFDWIENSTSGGLVVPDLYTLSNSAGPLPVPVEVEQRKEVYGYFTNLNFGYKNFLYLDLVGRIDVSSALPVDNNTYPYGSASLGWVFSEHMNSGWLDFGKLRASYAEVGNDTGPNRTTDVYLKNSNFGSSVLFTTSSFKRNQQLKPERLSSIEAGLEAAAFNGRLRLDLALYKTNATDQIIEIATSTATGFAYKYVNGGEIENKGIELSLGGDIIRAGDFTWAMDINWSKNNSLVVSLPSGIDNYQMNSMQGGVSTNVTVGYPYGSIRGTGYNYIDGQREINSSGYPVSVADQIIGDPNPDWNGGMMNRFSYKGLALGFLIDMSQGGDVYSLDMHYGQGTGLPETTSFINDNGVNVRESLDDGGGFIQEGVDENGAQNEVRARADFYGGAFYWGNSSRNPAQMTVYDASYVKLREMSLTYTFPNDLIDSFARNISISVVGRNLWIISKNVPYADPESGLGAGNGQGYLSGSYPTVKNLGFKIDFNF